MKILAHRGMWECEVQKNTLIAFHDALKSGHGVEIDIRDHLGHLVVSHDLPTENSPRLSQYIDIYKEFSDSCSLALNIKSDGLSSALDNLLDEVNLENIFVFDMSIPDAVTYLDCRVDFFTRMSEYETSPSLLNYAAGVWCDEFTSNWIDFSTLQDILVKSKKIAIVSPELHGRPYLERWGELRNYFKALDGDRIYLCTDYPEQARKFFNE